MPARVPSTPKTPRQPKGPCDIVPACEVPFTRQRDIFNTAFAGYVAGSMKMTSEVFARFLMGHGVDLFHSRFVRVNARPVGFGYINRSGNISRLGGMGVTPGARGTGAVDRLMERLLAEAGERGDHAMVLECFEQNPRALAVYRRHGFEIVGRMPGWQHTGVIGVDAVNGGALVEIPLLDAARWPSASEFPEIPWQVSRLIIPKLAPGARAFVHGEACLVISSPDASPVRISVLLSGDVQRSNWLELRNAVAALTRHFPDRTWQAPVVHPEEAGRGVFAPLGFVREPLNQVLMRKDLVRFYGGSRDEARPGAPA